MNSSTMPAPTKRKAIQCSEPRPLLEDPGADDGREHRPDVLQQDGIGGAGGLVGRDEEQHGAGQGQGRADLGQRPVELRPPQPGQQDQRGDQAARRGDGKGIPVDDLDEQPGAAPQESRGRHGQDAQVSDRVLLGLMYLLMKIICRPEILGIRITANGYGKKNSKSQILNSQCP